MDGFINAKTNLRKNASELQKMLKKVCAINGKNDVNQGNAN